MTEEKLSNLELALIRTGRALEYPPTPALASRVRERIERARVKPARWNFAPRPAFMFALAVLIALALLLAIPQTREAIGQLLGLRTIRIIPVTPTPTFSPTLTPNLQAIIPVTATPLATPTSTDVVTPPLQTPTPATPCCATSLADARTRARFQILAPANETPARVYLQDVHLNFGPPDAQQAILVFGDPLAPRWTLYESVDIFYGKFVDNGTIITATRVNNQPALWLTGAHHAVVYLDANGQPVSSTERTVSANTLAWEIGKVTFRLETNASLPDAVRFAESLR